MRSIILYRFHLTIKQLVSIIFLVLLFQLNCSVTYSPRENVTEETAFFANHPEPFILNMLVNFTDGEYELIDADIIEKTYTNKSITRVYGLYGVRGISYSNDELFDFIHYMKPVNSWVSIPFSSDLVGVEFYRRNSNEKIEISYFSRGDIITIADYIPRAE